MMRIAGDPSLVFLTLNRLPAGIRDLLGNVPALIGVDPLWVGLHRFERAADGRSYRETSHVVYTSHQMHLPASRREDTLVLSPTGTLSAGTVLHELGHILDARLGFYRPHCRPLDAYAARDRWEAFATAFQAWATPTPIKPPYHDRRELLDRDPTTNCFFDTLAERAS